MKFAWFIFRITSSIISYFIGHIYFNVKKPVNNLILDYYFLKSHQKDISENNGFVTNREENCLLKQIVEFKELKYTVVFKELKPNEVKPLNSLIKIQKHKW